MSLRLDHLVIGAASLAEGEAWCEATLGVRPSGGGKHLLMSTHNRLLNLSGPSFPRCYLEIIAIDPDAPPPGRARWFDLDSPALQQRLRVEGPGLIHWVARVDGDLEAQLIAWREQGAEAGEAVAASRMTAAGELRWRIALRADGQRLFGGALPLLIEWGEVHPADGLPNSGVSLQQLLLRLPQPGLLPGLAADAGEAWLEARLQTPLGLVSLPLMT
ncbi:VOC family protein [Roseateles oligotrophus]|uniref:VOC family protein n=1 Tax=Roseateles oligotrophus TaxID=1769250 RepID=A0ABT2YDD9_9BURK|nr:VOC family protein [Roseateles oligotrophus]MCV2368052.1 VOC family protein [Roseateles oligotrophus]